MNNQERTDFLAGLGLQEKDVMIDSEGKEYVYEEIEDEWGSYQKRRYL